MQSEARQAAEAYARAKKFLQVLSDTNLHKFELEVQALKAQGRSDRGSRKGEV